MLDAHSAFFHKANQGLDSPVQSGGKMKAHQAIVLILLFLMLFSSASNILARAATSFDPSNVSYYNAVKAAFNLTSEQETMLKNNGFVVVETPNTSDMWKPTLRFEDFYYSQVYTKDLPVFVTTDSILQLFHVVFDCSVRMLEKETFYPMVREMTQYAFNTTLNDYSKMANDGSVKSGLSETRLSTSPWACPL